jgi:hypothetical protein
MPSLKCHRLPLRGSIVVVFSSNIFENSPRVRIEIFAVEFAV